MTQSQPPRYYGARRDRPDPRDFKVRFQPEEIPSDETADLCEYVDHVYNQGQLGSCTANAVCAAYLIDLHKQKLKNFDPSRLFLYYNTRKADGKQDKDDGASPRDTVKTLKNQGVCPERKWPYVVSKFAIKPSEQCYQEAKGNIVSKYERIEKYSDKDQLRACLKAGFPFVFGFKVFPSFDNEAKLCGKMKMPTDEERKGKSDGHAVVAVGYDDKKKTVKVLNSWGVHWGDNGYFYMPYDFITDPTLCFDFWKIEFVQEGQATSKALSQQADVQIKGKENEKETSAREGKSKPRTRSKLCVLL